MATDDYVSVRRLQLFYERLKGWLSREYVTKDSYHEPEEASNSDIDAMFIVPNTVLIGGRRYRTVTVGNQEWLAENLDYAFDYNGSPLPIGFEKESTTPRAWYYDDNQSDYGIDGTYKCGLMYNWYAANYLDENKDTLLPEGWRVAHGSDWFTLFGSINADSQSDRGTVLKALDNSVTDNWPSGWNGTDEYNFSVLPAGWSIGEWDDPFGGIGSYANYWLPELDGPDEQDLSASAIKFDTTSTVGEYAYGDSLDNGMYIRLVRTIS